MSGVVYWVWLLGMWCYSFPLCSFLGTTLLHCALSFYWFINFSRLLFLSNSWKDGILFSFLLFCLDIFYNSSNCVTLVSVTILTSMIILCVWNLPESFWKTVTRFSLVLFLFFVLLLLLFLFLKKFWAVNIFLLFLTLTVYWDLCSNSCRLRL